MNTIINTPYLSPPISYPPKAPIAPVESKPEKIPTTPEVTHSESDRLKIVIEAATKVADSFILGDQRFTIYKDATGQYITRFTSLRDGKITYTPEPELLGKASRIDIKT